MQKVPGILYISDFGGKMTKFHEIRGFPKLARGGYPVVGYGCGTGQIVPGAQLNVGDCRKNDSEAIF